MEVWKDIQGYEGKYQISNKGNVKSLNYRNSGYSQNLVPKTNNSGRLWVELALDGDKKPMLIHRLVAMAFIPNPHNYPQINHKDENVTNNRAENLEWCTGEYNVKYFLDRHTQRGRPVRLNSPILQIDTEGNILKRWDNVTAIKNAKGFSAWSICECCKGNRKSAYGFKWQYAI